MKLERLTELVLERRFGTPDAAQVAELEAAAADPLGGAEIARVEALLDAAPAAGATASEGFSDALAARIDAEGARESQVDRRSLWRRAAAIYAGIALGAVVYAAWAGWFSDAPPEGIAGYSAALDFVPARLPR